MDVDAAAAAGHFGTPGDRAAVIAVGRRDHGQALQVIAMPALPDRGRVRPPPGLRCDMIGGQSKDSIGPAQRLEAAESQPFALVLVVNRGEAKPVGEAVEFDQRRRSVARPVRDLFGRFIEHRRRDHAVEFPRPRAAFGLSLEVIGDDCLPGHAFPSPPAEEASMTAGPGRRNRTRVAACYRIRPCPRESRRRGECRGGYGRRCRTGRCWSLPHRYRHRSATGFPPTAPPQP